MSNRRDFVKAVAVAGTGALLGGKDRIANMNKNMPLVLPVYARAKGLDPNNLPKYHSLALPKS